MLPTALAAGSARIGCVRDATMAVPFGAAPGNDSGRRRRRCCDMSTPLDLHARRPSLRDRARRALATSRLQLGLRALLFVGVVALLLSALAFALVHGVASALGLHRLQESALRRLDVGIVALDRTVARVRYLPALLQTTPEVQALLAAPDDRRLRQRASAVLARINAIVGTDMLFVLRPDGLSIAASDYGAPTSTYGHFYDFRPYLQQALATGRGSFFGIGMTTRSPGYFLSYALREGDRTLGVAAAKVDLEPAAGAWAPMPGDMLLVDHRGVVILSTREPWRFHALAPFDAAARAEILAERPYSADLPLLAWAGGLLVDGQTRKVRIGDDGDYLMTARAVPGFGWQMIAVDSLGPLQSSALTQALLAAALTAVAWLLAVAAWQSRQAAMQKLAAQAQLQAAHDSLDHRVQQRTQELRTAVDSLAAEIETRKAIERSLRATQSELVHAGKMAVLGQISAGLAHEFNQPLAALRTLSDNAAALLDKQRPDETRRNLERISQIVGRLGEVTRRLKTFAHKPGDEAVPTPLAAAAANVAGLLAERLRRDGVHLEVTIEPPQLAVMADPAAVEQVLVNLVVNALDAMAASPVRRLRLQAAAMPPRVRIAVTDTGPGVDPAMMARLFEPFATSKPRGAGLGLGLPISQRIVRDFGGDIFVTNNPGGGATFEIDLPEARAASVVA